MRLVLPKEDGLNAVACDRLLARLAEERARSADEITVDLANAAFIDPFGATFLVLIARHLQAAGQRVICVLPSDPQVQMATAELGVVSALRPLLDLRNVTTGSRPSPKASVLPISPIRSTADVQHVLSFLVTLARRRLGFEAGDVLDATKIVSELCNNVIDHSGAEGLAAARIAQDRQGLRYISLAVVDAGIGIRASLARRFPEASQWRHAEAIERALDGLSSRPEGGGVGLRSVVAVVRHYGGRLAVRSGNERLHLAAAHQLRNWPGVFFPGTQVGISFSQRP